MPAFIIWSAALQDSVLPGSSHAPAAVLLLQHVALLISRCRMDYIGRLGIFTTAAEQRQCS